jgi:hypothetical protein
MRSRGNLQRIFFCREDHCLVYLARVSISLNNPATAARLVQMIPKEYHFRGINGTLAFNEESPFLYKEFDMSNMLTLIAKEQSFESLDDLEDHPSYEEVWLDTEAVWISRIRDLKGGPNWARGIKCLIPESMGHTERDSHSYWT